MTTSSGKQSKRTLCWAPCSKLSKRQKTKKHNKFFMPVQFHSWLAWQGHGPICPCPSGDDTLSVASLRLRTIWVMGQNNATRILTAGFSHCFLLAGNPFWGYSILHPHPYLGGFFLGRSLSYRGERKPLESDTFRFEGGAVNLRCWPGLVERRLMLRRTSGKPELATCQPSARFKTLPDVVLLLLIFRFGGRKKQLLACQGLESNST